MLEQQGHKPVPMGVRQCICAQQQVRCKFIGGGEAIVTWRASSPAALQSKAKGNVGP